MWNWYVSRTNELMLDIDRPEAVAHMKKRLQGAIDAGVLQVEKAFLFPSFSGGHTHAIIILSEPMSTIERFTWEIILRSDIYRGCNNIMRFINNVDCPAVLIARKPFKFRKPDATCYCEGKHTQEKMKTCSAAIQLRGKNCTATFFGEVTEKEFSAWSIDE